MLALGAQFKRCRKINKLRDIAKSIISQAVIISPAKGFSLRNPGGHNRKKVYYLEKQGSGVK